MKNLMFICIIESMFSEVCERFSQFSCSIRRAININKHKWFLTPILLRK